MSDPWLLYGANGYTGELTARLAKRLGMKPILGGRNKAAVEKLAQELDFNCRIFDLNDAEKNLGALKAVLHTAGPFSHTSKPMISACLAKHVDYLDITGEIAVFEQAFRFEDAAKKAGIRLIPGVGFDVVPTDCLAASVALALPDATTLELGFMSQGGISRGTLKTAIEGFAEGGGSYIRRDGKIRLTKTAQDVRNIEFPFGTFKAISIPWGDIATAYRSTKIPNITVYMVLPEKQVRVMKLMSLVQPILATKPAQNFLKNLIDRKVTGPDEAARQKGSCHIWAEASNQQGKKINGYLKTPEGYSFTAEASLLAVKTLLSEEIKPGALTPSLAFGPDFVLKVNGVRDMVIK